MAPVFSRPLPKAALEALRLAKMYEEQYGPPICFEPKRWQKLGKADNEETDEKESRKFIAVKLKFDPEKGSDDTTNTYTERLYKFEHGFSEDWVNYRKDCDNIFVKQGVEDDYEKQHRMYQATLMGQAREYYNKAFNKVNVENNKYPPDERYSFGKLLELTLNSVAKFYFKDFRKARRRQVDYMENHLVLIGQDPQLFFARVIEMNDAIDYFPYDENKEKEGKLSDAVLISRVLSKAIKPNHWERFMMRDGKEAFEYDSINELEDKFVRYYEADKVADKDTPAMAKKESQLKKKSNSGKNPDQKPNKKKNKGKPKREPCAICGLLNHRAENCWDNPKNKKNDRSQKGKTSRKETTNMMSKKDVERMFNKCFASMANKERKNKRQIVDDSEEEVDNFCIRTNDDDSTMTGDSTSTVDSNNE